MCNRSSISMPLAPNGLVDEGTPFFCASTAQIRDGQPSDEQPPLGQGHALAVPPKPFREGLGPMAATFTGNHITWKQLF